MFSVSYHNQKSTNTTSQKLLSNQSEQSNGISKIRYFCQCDGKEVKICWSEGSAIRAAVKVPKKGFVRIPTDLLPTEFKHLSESNQFLNYLRDARIQLTRLHNGDQKLSVSQRLRGGMYHGNDIPIKVSPAQEAYAKILAFNQNHSPEGESLETTVHETVDIPHEASEMTSSTATEGHSEYYPRASSSASTFIHEPKDDLRTAETVEAFLKRESHHEAFRSWMQSEGLTEAIVNGEGLDSLIHALLQHTNGGYQEEDFSSTREIRDQFNQEFPDLTSEEILHDGDKRIIRLVNMLNEKQGTNLCVCFIRATEDGKPFITSQIGKPSSDNNVVVWNRETHYVSIISSQFQQKLSSPAEERSSAPEAASAAASSSVADSSDDSIQFNDTPWKDQLRLLYENILYLENPFLAKKILEQLQDLQTAKFSSIIGIMPWIDPLHLPNTTKTYFEIVNDVWTRSCTKLNSEGRAARILSLQNDISKLVNGLAVHIEEKWDRSWKELRLFFEIPEIMMLDNKSIKRILAIIEKKDINGLQYFVKEKLTRAQVNLQDLNRRYRKNRAIRNLDTLLSQIIKHKPEKKDDLRTYWNQPSKFFEGKTLYLNDPKSGGSIIGIIDMCQRNQEGFLFHLANNIEVSVSETFQINVFKKHSYNLLEALERGWWTVGESCEIDSLEKSFDRLIIEPGTYSYSKECKYVSETIFDRFKNFGNDVAALFSSNAAATSSSKTTENTPFLWIDDLTLTNQKNHKTYHLLLTYGLSETIFEKNICVLDVKITDPRGSTKQSSLHEINALKLIKKSETIFSINNVDTQIRIKNEFDPNAAKLYIQRQIVEKSEKLVGQLKKEHKNFLNQLIDNWVNNKLERIDLNLRLSSFVGLEGYLAEIAELYQEAGVENLPSQMDTLIQIVEDANYSSLFNEAKNVMVARTMNLLKDSDTLIERTDNKDLILFMGNTGSGKSTAVSYFLGAKLVEDRNDVGDRILKVAKGDDVTNSDSDSDPSSSFDDENTLSKQIKNKTIFPKMGESIGRSETLHAEGYQTPIKVDGKRFSCILVDCPGFNDTRGEDYELCTNMSIDETIRKAKSIKAIVVVVPYSAFFSDKGNPVLDLIYTIKEMFPNAFDPNNPNNNPVHLLITKELQSPKGSVDGIKDGGRINQLIREEQAVISNLGQLLSADHVSQVRSIEARLSIWETIRMMQNSDRVAYLTPTDEIERDELLQRYSARHSSVDKPLYHPRIQAKGMEQKLGKLVQESAHTWSHSIFEKFNKLRTAINLKSDQIKVLEKNLLVERGNLKTRDQQVANFQEEEARLRQTIGEIEKAITDKETSALAEETLESLKILVEQSNDKIIDNLRKIINNNRKQIKRKLIELKATENTIKNAEDDIILKETEIVKKRREVWLLETGFHWENLWEKVYQPNEEIEIGNVSRQDRQEAFDNIQDLSREKFSNIRKINTSTYTGTLNIEGVTGRDYKLVSIDTSTETTIEASRLEFENATGNVVEINKYVAKVEGYRYKYNLGKRVDPSGKKVYYSFITQWEGDGKLPWIKITYRVPKAEFNEIAIKALKEEIKTIKSEIKELKETLDGKDPNNKVDGLEEELNEIKPSGGARNSKVEILNLIESLTTNSDILQSQIYDLKETIFFDELQKILQAQKNLLQDTEKQRIDKQNSRSSEKEIQRYQHEIEECREFIIRKLRKKRNIAIVIYRQYENAQLIRAFSGKIVNHDEYAKAQTLANIIIHCTNFNNLFDREALKILKEAKQDLGLEAVDASAPTESSSSTGSSSSDSYAKASSSSNSGAASSSGSS